MIKGYYYQSMHVSGKGFFAETVIGILNRFRSKDPDFDRLLDNLEALKRTYDYSMARPPLAEYHQAVMLANRERNAAFLNLRRYAKSCSTRGIEAWAVAGRRICTTIRLYGWNLHQSDNLGKTTTINTLLSDFDTDADLAAAIDQLQAQGWIEELRASQQRVVEAEQARLNAQIAAKRPNTQATVREMGAAIDKLFRYINFMVEYKDGGHVGAAVGPINVVIGDSRALQKNRATRRRRRKEAHAAQADQPVAGEVVDVL